MIGYILKNLTITLYYIQQNRCVTILLEQKFLNYLPIEKTLFSCSFPILGKITLLLFYLWKKCRKNIAWKSAKIWCSWISIPTFNGFGAHLVNELFPELGEEQGLQAHLHGLLPVYRAKKIKVLFRCTKDIMVKDPSEQNTDPSLENNNPGPIWHLTKIKQT